MQRTFLSTILLIIALSWAGCRKCSQCSRDMVCAVCKQNGVAVDSMCSALFWELDEFANTCIGSNGTMELTPSQQEFDEFCDMSAEERDAWQASMEAEGYECKHR